MWVFVQQTEELKKTSAWVLGIFSHKSSIPELSIFITMSNDKHLNNGATCHIVGTYLKVLTLAK